MRNILTVTDLGLKIYVEPLLKELLTKSVKRKLKGRKIEIIIPINYGETVYKYATDEDKEHYDKCGYSTSQGNFSINTEKNKISFKLIINSVVFDKFQYFSTITHEFTHAVDFSEYIKKYGNPNNMSRSLKNLNYYFEFFLWTEFNAKRIGVSRLQKELDKHSKEIIISTSGFIQDVAGQVDNIPRLYHLMHFFGRISASQNSLIKLDPNIYPKKYLELTFGTNTVAIHSIIEQMNDFKDFENEKDLLRYLMFPNINYFC
jgi:hypothetical protein